MANNSKEFNRDLLIKEMEHFISWRSKDIILIKEYVFWTTDHWEDMVILMFSVRREDLNNSYLFFCRFKYMDSADFPIKITIEDEFHNNLLQEGYRIVNSATILDLISDIAVDISNVVALHAK